MAGIGQSSFNTNSSSGYSQSVASANRGGKVREDEFDPDNLYSYLDRGYKTIQDFTHEYQYASNYDYYKNLGNRIDYRYKLIDLYESAMLDLHLTSIVDSLFHQIVGERYSIKNSDGSINSEATKLIKKSWFPKYIRGVLESKLYGYTLMELGDLDKSTGSLSEVVSIQRRNVAPKDNLVLEYIHDASGWDITSNELKDDYVLIDGDEGLGMLLKALPLVMSKRFAISSHTQYAETYGTPMIVGKTTDDSYEEKKSLADEIAAARDSRVIVTGVEDEITFLNQISNDTNKIYTSLVTTSNDEMTMLILGQSATTESQAYAGSAEIQYRVMVDRVEAVREFVQNHVNEELIWRLQSKGMNIPKGSTFEYSNVLEMSPEAKKDLFQVLLGSYEVSSEEIESTFGVKVGRQILEESNDQLLTYGEETVKERGNPDKKISKDPEQALKDAKNKEKKAKKAKEVAEFSAEVNFFDSIAGCDLDTEASDMEKVIRKLNSKELSDIEVINDINNTYKSHHKHEIDLEAALVDDIDKFASILESLYPRIYAGDESVLSQANLELAQAQYDILSEIFAEEYGISLDSMSGDGYAKSVSNFFATFSASKQLQLLKIISSLAKKYKINGRGYDAFVNEARKINELFNKAYHQVEGDVMHSGYSFAKDWRAETDDQIILQYKTQNDAAVRDEHSALEGIKMRKADWANSSFLPPWAYGCRCYLFNTGSTNGQLLTKSRKLPSEDIVPKEFRTNVGESGAVFSRQHPYYSKLQQSDATEIRNVIKNIKR